MIESAIDVPLDLGILGKVVKKRVKEGPQHPPLLAVCSLQTNTLDGLFCSADHMASHKKVLQWIPLGGKTGGLVLMEK